ncbi:MAG: 16S rRNA processing protein RimM [Candidatus Accumulibacter sp.]|jgi:16S rRNA processing protein RimM|uniref:Ribosome maturation factor RimM n=1 Tax=Candidatus Accumulibacter affinis TaxID=2954384 RepID=A0A935W4X0_9PROT|nr:16S rRNA processing protein RimM [Candidatus Accumulibacter affinis]MBP9803541.1 16S rRNA processing protein RimM [Accumulibacter sp.]
MIVLGKVAAACGLHGEVRVFPYADDPLAWSRLPHWWIGQEGDAPPLWRQTRLIKCQVRNDLLIAQLACASDRTAAEAMRGVLVGAPRAALPPTRTDEYYWADLVGLEVINTREQSLGCILGLIETPANTVLRVADGEGAERLLPFVAAVVLDVDLVERRVRVDWEADW